MKLYHVTTDLNHNGLFTPSVPSFRLKDEEDTLKRVCTSFSLEGALTGMPRGGFLLRDTLKMNNGLLKICELDVEDAGLRIDDLVFPYLLFEKGWVKDALLTEEVWVLRTFQAQRMLTVHIQEWEEYEDDIYPEWCRDKAIDIPVSTKIENIKYQVKEEKIVHEKKKIC